MSQILIDLGDKTRNEFIFEWFDGETTRDQFIVSYLEVRFLLAGQSVAIKNGERVLAIDCDRDSLEFMVDGKTVRNMDTQEFRRMIEFCVSQMEPSERRTWNESAQDDLTGLSEPAS